MHILKALDLYEIQLQANGRSPHTQRQYRRHIRLFAAWLAENGHSAVVTRIDHETVATFLASPAARCRPDGGVKKAMTQNALRTSLRTFFSYLHEAGQIRTNPARLVKRAICGAAPPRALSDAEAGRLMGALASGEGPEAERDYIVFHLLLATGIRIGSAIALDVEDVDLGAGELRLRSTKGNRPQVVYLSTTIRDHLDRYIGSRTSGPLFLGRHHARITCRHAQRRFRDWCNEAGIRVDASCHSLRHTLATRLYQQTGDLFLVQQALRHRSIMSTVVYASMDDRRLRRVMEG